MTRSDSVLISALGAIGTVIAAAGSWVPSLGTDETVSVMSATRSLPSLAAMLPHVDAVHGLYYSALHVWIGLVGRSDFAVRIPSALGVGVAVAGIAFLFLRMGRTRLAVTAAVVFMVLPRTTYMGEEARSYAWSAAVATWLMVLVLELIRVPRVRTRRLLVAYAVVLAFGIYLFLYLALMALVLLVVVWRASNTRALRRPFIIATVISLAAASPVEAFAFLERAQIGHRPATPGETFVNIAVSAWFSAPIVAVVAWALIALSILVAVRRSRWILGLPVWTFALPWLAIPPILLGVTSLVVADFTARYLAFCTPAVAILIAGALESITRRRVVINALAVAGIVALIAPVYLSQRGPYSKNGSDTRELSAAIAARSHPGDAIMFDQWAGASKQPRMALHAYPSGFIGLKDVGLGSPYEKTTGWNDRVWSALGTAQSGRLDGVRRLWLVEYRSKKKVDTYARETLALHGFTVGEHFHTHRDRVYEMVRREPTPAYLRDIR